MSSIPSVTASNGIFTVTNASGQSQQVDLGTLMMMLNLERTENLDAQIADLLTEIQDRNDQISAMTEFLSQMRSLKADGADDGWADLSYAASTRLYITINGETKPIQGPDSWAEEFGITWTDVQGTRGDKKGDDLTKWNGYWDANIEALKGKVDLLNNDSQMDNIRLQNLLEKRTNAFEMASKVMDTNNQSIESTIRNL